MPNHVRNIIMFKATEEDAQKIFEAVIIENEFNFETLIPRSLNVYKDYTCYEWNIENWGTKWNAYETEFSWKNGNAEIFFWTAWSVPYPVIIAFANRFMIDFEFSYIDECESFQGEESWKIDKETKKPFRTVLHENDMCNE